ncbi:MAG: hypothetical protein NVSMB26_08270 [Beijerinckiaceae bacterium]
MTNAAVFALGLGLIVGGAWGMWRGSGYIQIEQGWSAVISGSVAVTGGVLTLAIAFVLLRLDALQQALLFAGARAIAQPLASPAMEEAAAAPMPLGIEVGQAADLQEPQAADLFDWPAESHAPAPAEPVEAHERLAEGHAESVHDNVVPVPVERPNVADLPMTEVPTETVQRAQPGEERDSGREPAFGKAAGVSDEPELDAAIEELLAEERRAGYREENLGAGEALASLDSPGPKVFADSSVQDHRTSPAATVSPPPAPKAEPEPEPVPVRASLWKGLFSARNREPTRPRDDPALPQPSGDGQAPAEALPKTGDDWFDRALAGLDEVANGAESRGHPVPVEPSAPAAPALEIYDSGEAARAEPPRQTEPAVIGRYTSGNTTYVMFADGSIEAETPNGILRFASLADLKTYVEGGQ